MDRPLSDGNSSFPWEETKVPSKVSLGQAGIDQRMALPQMQRGHYQAQLEVGAEAQDVPSLLDFVPPVFFTSRGTTSRETASICSSSDSLRHTRSLASCLRLQLSCW